LQNPSQINGDNLQNLRYETSRTFRKKKREYLKGKINELLEVEIPIGKLKTCKSPGTDQSPA
jgi:hypothetical protein